MKASLRSVRIAPKKASLVAKMVRGMKTQDAIAILGRTHKKAARILEKLIESAVANAQQNEKQSAENLVIRSLTVNKAQAYHRGVPMARGRVRPMRKFLSHIAVTLGVEGRQESPNSAGTKEKKAKVPSQKARKTVQTSRSSSKKSTPDHRQGSSSTKKTSPNPPVSADSTPSSSV
ncbi:MAG: 50S ribosomal protein L22 [Candidatus Peribacteraceae bacterium]